MFASKSFKIVIFLLLTTLLLAGCTNPIDVRVDEQESVKLEMNDPKPVRMNDIEWIVITRENAEDVFSTIEKDGFKVVLFGLTDKGYEKLSLNMAELKRFIIEQNLVLSAYREYYEPDASGKDSNKEQKSTSTDD